VNLKDTYISTLDVSSVDTLGTKRGQEQAEALRLAEANRSVSSSFSGGLCSPPCRLESTLFEPTNPCLRCINVPTRFLISSSHLPALHFVVKHDPVTKPLGITL
jgi:hypothetical protein